MLCSTRTKAASQSVRPPQAESPCTYSFDRSKELFTRHRIQLQGHLRCNPFTFQRLFRQEANLLCCMVWNRVERCRNKRARKIGCKEDETMFATRDREHPRGVSKLHLSLTATPWPRPSTTEAHNQCFCPVRSTKSSTPEHPMRTTLLRIHAPDRLCNIFSSHFPVSTYPEANAPA